jgi:hypothetical protein
VWLQLALSLYLLRRELARTFGTGAVAVPLAPAGA